MKIRSRGLAYAAVTLALTLGAGSALAQQSDTAPAAPSAQTAPTADGKAYHKLIGPHEMGGGWHGQCREPGFGGMMMMRYPDGTLAFLHTELHINQSEEANWQAFASAIKDNAKEAQARMKAHMQAHMDNAKAPPALPQMLQMREQMAEWHLASMKRVDAALIPLYNSLDAAQKQKADRLMLPCHPGPMGADPMGHGPMDHGGGM